MVIRVQRQIELIAVEERAGNGLVMHLEYQCILLSNRRDMDRLCKVDLYVHLSTIFGESL